MERTPEPPTRARTPPTPLHGARYDAYEPYSPRRSTRVAAQRKPYPQLNSDSTPPKAHRPVRALTPTGNRKHPARTSSQTFSPPSSPSSPIAHSPAKNPRSVPRRRIANTLRKHHDLHSSDSDDMGPGDASTSNHLSVLGMLPTPAKTPRKRDVQNAAIGSTARVLFPSRPTNVDDAMPTPRKNRKAKKNAFTLQSFAEADDEDEEKIEIYTDTKERIPRLDPDEDNPFVTRTRNGKTKASAINTTPDTKRRKISSGEEERVRRMEEKAKNNEGMIYVFRGRKIFRKFDDAPASVSSASDNEATLSSTTIRRKAGADVHRPFTRSTIKPRLLFPNDEQRREREAAELADEEATTDIEVPVPVPSSTRKGKGRAIIHEAVTPVKSHFHPATPPSTGRRTRRMEAAEGVARDLESQMEIDHQSEEEARTPQPKGKGKKTSPFDAWQRVKPAAKAVAGKGTKREGEPLESAGKRVRSGVGSAGV